MGNFTRFLRPYYLCHLLVLASYPLARHYAVSPLPLRPFTAAPAAKLGPL